MRVPLIVYGSETGNAEDIAYTLYQNWQTNFPCRVASAEDIDFTTLAEEEVLVFIVSTCGDGEFPLPMRSMWTGLLRRSLPASWLSNIRYAVFGLGDSSYEKFNAAARKLYVRLQQLGATPLLPLANGLGDDQAGEGYLAALDPWVRSITPILQETYSASSAVSAKEFIASGTETLARTLTSLYNIEALSTESPLGSYHPRATAVQGPIYETIVTENQRLTHENWPQAVHHLAFTLASNKVSSTFGSSDQETLTSLCYEAGDVAQVFYENPAPLVQRLEQYFCRIHSDQKLTPDTVLHVTPTLATSSVQPETISSVRKSRLNQSITCTLHQLFAEILDVGAIPKRSFFFALSHFALEPGSEQQLKLREISSAQGADLYYDYCLRERRCYEEVLTDFANSVHLPLSCFIGLVPIIVPRPYSIASSPRSKRNALELCVGVVQRVTPYRRKRTGLCSGYLASLSKGHRVFMSIMRGSFPHYFPFHADDVHTTFIPSTIPPPPPSAMILIGPGTGIAPMRALLQDRILYEERQQRDILSDASPKTGADLRVYFGCRRELRDDLYRNEWDALNCHVNPYTVADLVNEDSSDTALLPPPPPTSQPALPQVANVRVETAFSQNVGQLVKVYVTHLIQRDAIVLWQLLQRPDCFVGIAGSAKRMPRDVKTAFVQHVLQGAGGLTEGEAQAYLQRMAREKRWAVEAWG